MRSDCTFFHPVRVRYNEVDQQKIVHNAVYIVYTECALDEFFRVQGYSVRDLVERYDSEICHRKTVIEYNASAFDGDLLDVGLYLVRLGERSFTLNFEIYRAGEDEMLVSLESIFVGYDVEHRCSRPITTLMRQLLEGAFLGGEQTE